MKKVILSLLLLILIFSSATATAENSPAPDWKVNLEAGDSYFQKGLQGNPDAFISASREYRTALNNGAPMDYRIFYNRGNALYLSAFPGEAAAEYRRALFYKPGDEKSRQNLNQILEETGAAPEEQDMIQTILFAPLYLAGYERALYTGLILFSLSWMILLVPLFIRKKIFFRLVLIFLLISLWDLTLCYAWHSSASGSAVITAGQVSMRIGDSYAYETLHSSGIPAGTAFDILEERAGWIFIRLKDGSEGWIEKKFAVDLLISGSGA